MATKKEEAVEKKEEVKVLKYPVLNRIFLFYLSQVRENMIYYNQRRSSMVQRREIVTSMMDTMQFMQCHTISLL